jgi:hypothetical protein
MKQITISQNFPRTQKLNKNRFPAVLKIYKKKKKNTSQNSKISHEKKKKVRKFNYL